MIVIFSETLIKSLIMLLITTSITPFSTLLIATIPMS